MSNNIITRKADRSEMDWINSCYREIGFVKSDFDKEFIVISEVDGHKAGLGRVVVIDKANVELGGIYVLEEFRKMGVAESIVTFLCDNNPFADQVVWCLPFEHLKEFYSSFGFAENKGLKAPKEIAEKHLWCNDAYQKKVLLLSKT
ncbi:GNAT family N-acetyltransferase [Leptobacterium flavescens]|uniref:GNAT family N-acetyltransferase n=1 Tax=Leptobacterium flavescens TaxID=472055 RepID=A0A6P0UFI4_9FLAO|nr:GNAT family N-acetyltransferase [Leptobacterium flavescens]NER12041.1 GNAT family N-acetyltransferase [Leptobacterium flavescens]